MLPSSANAALDHGPDMIVSGDIEASVHTWSPKAVRGARITVSGRRAVGPTLVTDGE